MLKRGLLKTDNILDKALQYSYYQPIYFYFKHKTELPMKEHKETYSSVYIILNTQTLLKYIFFTIFSLSIINVQQQLQTL